jgi:hypothetical protein
MIKHLPRSICSASSSAAGTALCKKVAGCRSHTASRDRLHSTCMSHLNRILTGKSGGLVSVWYVLQDTM